MKPVSFFILSLTLMVVLFSCTESVKMKYNETKSLPIKADMNGIKIEKLGTLTPDILKQLLNIPSDAKVTKFAITGFTIQVNTLNGTDADYIEYIKDKNFSNKNLFIKSFMKHFFGEMRYFL